MKTVLITGSHSGLGRQLVDKMLERHFKVMPYDIANGHDVLKPDLSWIGKNLDILVNCAGVNRINWLDDVSEDEWDHVMDVNVKGMFLMSQACEQRLRASGGTILNIVSNAAHIPMRASAAYNASKAAALGLTRQLARELAPHVTVFSVSPNKLAGTGMSLDIERQVMSVRNWTKEQARQYQHASLLTGEETPVSVVAEFIAFLLSDKSRHKYLAGCDIPYGA